MAMTAHEAGRALAGVFGDSWFAGDNGLHFTCGEANVVADVLVETGQREAAVTWLAGHAIGDDEGDDHFGMDEAGVEKYLDKD